MASQLCLSASDVEATDEEGRTSLHLAVISGDVATLHSLLKYEANIRAVDGHRNSPLQLAVLNGQTSMVNQLIEFGADAWELTSRIGGSEIFGRSRQTALHLMAGQGCCNSVRKLVAAGANIEARDKQENTPLHLAGTNGHTATVCTLVALGADVCARNKQGETALHLAAKNGHSETVAQLVRCGVPGEAQDAKGRTALLVAIKCGFTDVAQQLSRVGTGQNAPDHDGNTALHHTIMVGREPNVLSTLIAEGADVDVRNDNGESALLVAAKTDYTSAACKLVHAGADPDTADNDGNTPLTVASKRGNTELCCELLDHSAKMDDTISFFACFRNVIRAADVRLLARIIAIGASVNVRSPNESGETPLHIAAGAGASFTSRQARIEIIQMLLVNGADPTAVNSQLQTPFQVAEQCWNLTVAAVLEKAELTYQLVKAVGEAKLPEVVAIRLGGPPGAGKSTLARSLQVSQFSGYFRYESQPDESADNMDQRTKGINCHTFVDEKSSRFKIFDLGGQGEFLATHQMFIGDGSVPVIDCVVVSALDAKLKDNALKWCSLFASRNQPTLTPSPLLLIATRADRGTEKEQQAVMGVYHEIKQTFSKSFQFPCSKPLFIDARKSWGGLTVELRQVLNQLHRKLVSDGDSLRQPALCQSIEESLPALQATASSPVVLKEKFIEFMLPRLGYRLQLKPETDASGVVSLFDKALKYLSGYASVLAFNQPLAQRYVVINPQWLLSDIVGRLMSEHPLPGPYVHYDNGYAQASDVVAALETEHLPGPEALEMVAGLGFCLEQVSRGTVLNPSKLLGYRREEHWSKNAAMIVNAGRRLKCKGSVAIASAFFPRLQVHFYHRYLVDYDEKLPMWMGGIRLVAGQLSSVEALIEADPKNLSIDIIVRGREGSQRECADLLHSLTEETLQTAVEISPGSELCLFFLSKLELDKLSPAGLPSRPLVEYAEDRVLRAISCGSYVTDGNASTPEKPHDLLLPQQFEQQASLAIDRDKDTTDSPTQTLPIPDWRVVLLRVANAVNSYDECDGLAEGLCLNGRGEDIVKKLLQVDPRRLSSDIAFYLFDRWLQGEASQMSTVERRESAAGCLSREAPATHPLRHSWRRAEGIVQQNWYRVRLSHHFFLFINLAVFFFFIYKVGKNWRFMRWTWEMLFS